MKKALNIFLAVLIAFFAFPVSGLQTAAAEGENGGYVIPDKVSTINYTMSSHDSLFVKPATLLEKDGKKYLQFKMSQYQVVNWLKADGQEVKKVDTIDAATNTVLLQFELKNNELNEKIELEMDMSYGGNHILTMTVNLDSLNEENDPSAYRIYLENQEDENSEEQASNDDENNKGEESQNPKGKEGETSNRNDANLIDPKDTSIVDRVDEDVYIVSTLNISSYFNEKAKVITLKNGKRFIEMRGSKLGNSLQSLTLNGKEVNWGTVQENGSYRIQFEINGPLSTDLDFKMVVNAGPMGTKEYVTKLSFAKKYSSTDTIKVSGDEKIIINNNEVLIIPPATLPPNVELNIVDKKESVENQGDLIIAGPVYDFDFSNLGSNPGKFEISFTFDNSKYDPSKYDVAIYYYDEVNNKWIKQNSEVFEDTISAEVDHFSTYGVFATEKTIDPTNLAEGYYKANYTFLKSGTNEPSTTQGFTEGPAYLKVDSNGNVFAALTFTSADMIEYLEVNGTKATTIFEDIAQNKRVVEFKVDDITNKISGKIKVSVPGFYNQEHNVDLVFDVDTIEVVDESEYPKSVDSGPTPTPTPPANQGGDSKSGGDKNKKDDKVSKVKPNKVSTFDYVIYKEDADEPSAANQFFVKPGYLLEKDGKKYIQLKINGWNFINWLKVKATNKDVDVVEVNGNEALIQFEYNGSLSDAIWLVMNLTVPGVYDGETYEARLIIDPDSLTEVDPEGYFIYQDVEKPSDFGTASKADEDVEKPSDFGTASKADGDKKKQSGNPKTGDTSQVWFFTMLLIVSMIPLIINLRRRFA